MDNDLMIAEHNASSGEVTYREMTEQEKADRQMQQARIEEIRLAEEAVLAKRQEVLDRLGLTLEDVNALLGIPVIPDAIVEDPTPASYEDTVFTNQVTVMPTGPVA